MTTNYHKILTKHRQFRTQILPNITFRHQFDNRKCRIIYHALFIIKWLAVCVFTKKCNTYLIHIHIWYIFDIRKSRIVYYALIIWRFVFYNEICPMFLCKNTYRLIIDNRKGRIVYYALLLSNDWRFMFLQRNIPHISL